MQRPDRQLGGHHRRVEGHEQEPRREVQAERADDQQAQRGHPEDARQEQDVSTSLQEKTRENQELKSLKVELIFTDLVVVFKVLIYFTLREHFRVRNGGIEAR